MAFQLSQLIEYDEYAINHSNNKDASKLFYDNVRLVPYVIKKYNLFIQDNPSADIEDIKQIGYIALWLCCLRYNPTLDISFATYAIPNILGTIQTYKNDKCDTIRIPRPIRDMCRIMVRHNIELPFTEEDITFLKDNYGYDDRYLRNFTIPRSISIDTPIDIGVTLEDTIPDNHSLEYFESVDSDISNLLNDMLKDIPIKHRTIMRDYLVHEIIDRPITQQELAKKYKVSQSYISRLIRVYRNEIKENRQLVLV